MDGKSGSTTSSGSRVTLFLAGDVMLGRGIDQILPRSNDPRLHEPVVQRATRYVTLAEAAHGSIPHPVGHSYVWGRALEELERVGPDARIVNLETAMTTSDAPWPGKGIHYRMHPANVPVLETAQIGCAVLSNNHVMDWGAEGLRETLGCLEKAGISTAGAGRDLREAKAPAVMPLEGGDRILVFGVGDTSSGIPPAWRAGRDRPGVWLLEETRKSTLQELAAQIGRTRRAGDIVVVSIHWGGNWGFEIPRGHREFAHGLVDEAGVDVVHGHSSHHAMGIEVYRDRPILYGSGDFLNDYEGISGYGEFRDDLALMYFTAVTPEDGTLFRFRIVPLRIRRFRLEPASPEDLLWLKGMLDREGRSLGTRAELVGGGMIELHWK